MLSLLLSNFVADPESQVGYCGLTLLACYSIWLGVHWLLDGPAQPDPWDAHTTAEMEAESAQPLCHRCLTPNDSLAHFCSNCGAPVGMCTNLLPFPYVFSIGYALRVGTEGAFRRSPLTVAGYILMALAEYTLFAPVYWYLLARRLRQSRPAGPAPNHPQGEAHSGERGADSG